MERASAYEKRKRIFDVANDQLGAALFNPERGMSRYKYFMRARFESKLLFGPEVSETLVDIGKFVAQMYNQHTKEKGMGTLDETEVISAQDALQIAKGLAERLDKYTESYLNIVE